MGRLKVSKLIQILTDKSISKTDLAYKHTAVINELDNTLADTKDLVSNLPIEQAIKFILWNGVWNLYGIFGNLKDQAKTFKVKDGNATVEKTYYNERFNRGKILSIDFGTSNIGRELSYTHGGIVIADYVGSVVVVPMTSQKSFGLSHLSPDIQKVIIPINKSDYPNIREDSYILTHQIRSVSKNRITKVITSISQTPLMQDLEEMLYSIHSPYIRKLTKEDIESKKKEIIELEDEIIRLNQIIENQLKEIKEYKTIDSL